MGTRTNFYKNPSNAYNKQFNLNSVLQNLKTYNIATGNASSEEPTTVVQRKRRREPNPRPDQRDKVKESDGPMSHQEYIEKRRKEADFSQPYQELTADVLESSSSALNLVGYESETSTSAECEEDRGAPQDSEEQLNSSNGIQYFPISDNTEEADRIKTRTEQRYPAPGEPVCSVCGKYGEYICNETNDDICSMECKAELLQSIKFQQEPQSGQLLVEPFSARRCTLEVPESGGDTWDYDRNRWSKKRSGLCTYECWKCQKPGHLAEDCLVSTSHCESSPAGEAYNHVLFHDVNGNFAISPSKLHDYINMHLLYRCHEIGKRFLDAKCNSCRGSTTLAACLSCDNTFCDCAGHLSEHIRGHPTHQQYYSYKLKRLVKCCKSTCKVTAIKDLLACHYCFNKAFDKFYDMYTATWKPSGLSIIWNSICCEDHFEWHRMNCLSADVEDNAYIFKHKQSQNKKSAQLGDFIF
ncbi:putative ATP-dependent RNA helicase DDX59 [Sesamum alatum]|uniref:ATP-dependent RNA helicase DDX59 n=1 Tax=Sesamum alatum TaxID=300844 RepID=A0AAE2CUK3_9LAMI|nr:putative ATP-dependent RNA helicase DDX59 [Sesamum alatum]